MATFTPSIWVSINTYIFTLSIVLHVYVLATYQRYLASRIITGQTLKIKLLMWHNDFKYESIITFICMQNISVLLYDINCHDQNM